MRNLAPTEWEADRVEEGDDRSVCDDEFPAWPGEVVHEPGTDVRRYVMRKMSATTRLQYHCAVSSDEVEPSNARDLRRRVAPVGAPNPHMATGLLAVNL